MSTVVIEFPSHYDERGEYEAEQKGLLVGVIVRVSTGDNKIEVTFMTPLRLTQELDMGAEFDQPWVVEKNLLVVESITKTLMERAIHEAIVEGFLSS
mgnify:CR=1 FL=1